MNRTLLSALFLLCAAVAWADRVPVPGTRVSFEAPAGFTELAADEIAIKFPSRNPPGFAVGDERRKTTVACGVRELALTDEMLPTMLEALRTSLGRTVPGIEWKRHELVDLAGQRWLWLEFTSRALDADIYNMLLMTPLDGKTLTFNFNAAQAEFPIHEAALRASIASIRID